MAHHTIIWVIATLSHTSPCKHGARTGQSALTVSHGVLLLRCRLALCSMNLGVADLNSYQGHALIV